MEKGTVERIRNRVRMARLEKDLTQQKLADLIGVTRQTIGLIERERYNPTIALCLKLSRVLKKDLGKLFWLEVKETDEER